MSSPTRTERGDANRLDLRTLVIASLASAVAAIVVSRIWASGTPIAAAATPVLVTLLKEVLDRPTSKIADRFTAETGALPDREVREPSRAHARRDRAASRSAPPRSMPPPTGTRAPAADGAGDIRVYRQQASGPIRRRIHPKAVLITGLLAFVIAGLIITGGQVLAGHPFGSKGSGAIILGQHKAGKKASSDQQEQQPTTPDQQSTTPQQQTTPEQQPTTTTPSKQAPPTQSTPQQAPRSGGTPTTPATPPASP